MRAVPCGRRPQERAGYAREAATLLARIAARPDSPFEADLARIEPALAVALNTPSTSLSATAAPGDVPDPNAQRGLADVLIDPSKPAPLRLIAAGPARPERPAVRPARGGRPGGEARFPAFDRETDPALRTALGTVVGALRPKSAPVGRRLRRLDPDVTTEPGPRPGTTTTPDNADPNAPPALPSPEAAQPPPEAAPWRPNRSRDRGPVRSVLNRDDGDRRGACRPAPSP